MKRAELGHDEHPAPHHYGIGCDLTKSTANGARCAAARASEKTPEAVAPFQHTLPTQFLTYTRTAQQQGYAHWRVWTQDESRCGLLPIVRRRITARGVPPLVSAACHFESLSRYGAVE